MVINNEIREIEDLVARSTMARMTTESIVLKLGMKAKPGKVKAGIVNPLPIKRLTSYADIHGTVVEAIREVVEKFNLPIQPIASGREQVNLGVSTGLLSNISSFM
jgi:hypothetical protein